MALVRLALLLAVAFLAAVFVPWALFGGAGLLLGFAGVRWWRITGGSADPAAARRRGLLVVTAGVGVIAVCAALTLGLYARDWGEASRRCRAGRFADALAERRRLLAEASPYMRRVGFFNERVFVCEELEADLSTLAGGECPEFPPKDTACRCGGQAWPADWKREGSAKCDGFDEKGNLRKGPPALRPRKPYDHP